MSVAGKKIGILMESDFYEPEIFYYERRFAEEGMEVHFLSRLWGQGQLTFKGHEYQVPFNCHERARTGAHCHLFVKEILKQIKS